MQILKIFWLDRSASRHSRAASNAFLRGDHVSAKQLRLKAKEEWAKAEQLNSKAANEILDARNCNNNLWKLDLHGLHVAEAVQALREHLWKIETQMTFNRSASPCRTKTKVEILRSPSLESFSCVDNEELDKQLTLSRQRPTSLLVITGIKRYSLFLLYISIVHIELFFAFLHFVDTCKIG